MPEITFQFDIHADRAKVLDALNTHDGLTSWWTTGVDRKGESLFFDFPGIPQPFELRREAASEDVVTWTSIGAFPPHWKDTVIKWRMTDTGSGATRMLFRHSGFQEEDADMPGSAYTWGQLMVRLKDFLETGKPQPLFTV